MGCTCTDCKWLVMADHPRFRCRMATLMIEYDDMISGFNAWPQASEIMANASKWQDFRAQVKEYPEIKMEMNELEDMWLHYRVRQIVAVRVERETMPKHEAAMQTLSIQEGQEMQA